MWKYILIVLSSLLIAILQVSFVPNFAIFGGIILLPILIIVYKITRNYNPKKNLETYLFSLSLGLFLDLFSGGKFLSFTLILFVFTVLLNLLRKVSLAENPLIFANLSLLIGVFCYDALFMALNNIIQVNSKSILALVFDLVLTTAMFWIIMAITSRFNNRHRHSEIKL